MFKEMYKKMKLLKRFLEKRTRRKRRGQMSVMTRMSGRMNKMSRRMNKMSRRKKRKKMLIDVYHFFSSLIICAHVVLLSFVNN